MAITGHSASLALLLSLALGVADAIRTLKEGPMIDAEGREFKSALVRADADSRPQSNDGSTIRVQCTEVSMIIVVNADVYKNGRLVSPGDLFLGGAEHSESGQCQAVAVSDAEYVIEAGLQDCGSKLTISEDSVIYSNNLVFSPAASYHGITRMTHAVVPVSCHYKRTHFVSSNVQLQQPLALSTSAQYSTGPSAFSLKLMTDDWTRETFSSVFYLGDLLHLEASYAGPDAGQRRLFINSCVATLTPDTASVPRYYFIENHGCVTDAKEEGSNTLFKPRTTAGSLQLQLDVFLFHHDPRNSIFITCQMKATTGMWKSSPVNKACNYIHSRWKSVDGHIGVCQCCDSTCHKRSIKGDKMVCGTVTLGPLMIFPSKHRTFDLAREISQYLNCGDIIKRDAYEEANGVLDKIVHQSNAVQRIESVNIYHHPGSGGSTVAWQILWNWRKKVRCAVVKQCKEIQTVCEHAVNLREHGERDKNNCLPVLLLLEDRNADYIDDLRREIGNVTATKKIRPSMLCFILLICNRSNDPERMCRASPSQTVPVTHKLSNAEKPLFSKKLEQLKLQFQPDFILTFVLMSEEFRPSYIEDFVTNLLDKIDHSSLITRLIRFVAILNWYVEDSYISVSHCEASLGIATLLDKVHYHAFVDHLSDEAKLIFIHLKESFTHISSIRIIHPLVAKEILTQLSVNLPQSDIAMDLITDKVLINHRFDRDEFLKFIRALFIRRHRKSRGDLKDTAFSPIIEHVSTKRGDVQKAVDLMKAAYLALGKDAYVAQQLARLLYTNLRFEEALEWAEEAKSLLPHDTFVLDTLGQVYKRWFYHLYDTLEEKEPSPEREIEIISTALRGISAFRASEKAPKKETVSINSSYYGEVDVSCRLLKFLSGVNVFSNDNGKSELMKYLLTDYIPAEVKIPWQRFHQQLKGLQKCLSQALECISEDLSYFQTDISEKDEELDARDPEQVYNPREWLTRKSAVYAVFFCVTRDDEVDQAAGGHGANMADTAEKLSPFQRQMRTYKLGGGNVTAILSLLYDKNQQKAGKKLETIIGIYPEDLKWNDLDSTELANFIFCQIALNCILPGSSKLLSLEKLKGLSKRFIIKGKNMSSASALFLLSLLFWPETTDALSSAGSETLSSAIDALQRLCEQKIQHVSPRKSRIMTHFFLGKARGLNKIVHRSLIEKHIKGTLSERRLKWLGGEVWKDKEVVQLLKRVEGWTESGNLFVQGVTRDSKIRVFPRYSASLPNGNENVTFYLGFTYDGVAAFDIQVME